MPRIAGPQPFGTCLHCSKEFAYKRYGDVQKFHYNRKQKYCSRACVHAARRTRYIDKKGYVITNWSVNGKRAYITEHRTVMEKFLGRTLTPYETVHHINGVRHDNRIENLEMWSNRHPKGQRVDEKIEFARSILLEYGIDAPLTSASDAVRGIAGLI